MLEWLAGLLRPRASGRNRSGAPGHIEKAHLFLNSESAPLAVLDQETAKGETAQSLVRPIAMSARFDARLKGIPFAVGSNLASITVMNALGFAGYDESDLVVEAHPLDEEAQYQDDYARYRLTTQPGESVGRSGGGDFHPFVLGLSENDPRRELTFGKQQRAVIDRQGLRLLQAAAEKSGAGSHPAVFVAIPNSRHGTLEAPARKTAGKDFRHGFLYGPCNSEVELMEGIHEIDLFPLDSGMPATLSAEWSTTSALLEVVEGVLNDDDKPSARVLMRCEAELRVLGKNINWRDSTAST